MEYDKIRRDQVSFDARYFEKEKHNGVSYTLKETFDKILSLKLWGSTESVSGEGSSHHETRLLNKQLNELLTTYKIRILLDAPCGDLNWITQLNLSSIRYIGIDIVESLIQQHTSRYQDNDTFTFFQSDITRDPLPASDLIMCRDALVHFSHEDSLKALKNFKKSGASWLLTTTFPKSHGNTDITTGDWYPINLEKAPFNLPKPYQLIVEGCLQNNGMYEDKSLGLWRLEDLKI
ncbi:Mg-protoporphyrin IX methyl transferase [Legionella geestiana]|uniref:Mg-protoporphyrin IX methyl transferase n=1 Tax=Legionella geestiana TaxID=45065 RepID=A0A0W0UBF3_9GAMM|nr:class I SAM-dependent methyltransferase [Legionella geestiana]KTD04825.1 Mg-protoporphyrin IX methyl transferase [Legionella geestiana]QBS11346.1 class I SAM-dependent methyltransferase [Legionella geestiana]QDQ38899.1 class I SAM-dependent methyltransferase [Legionella geestiana]STX54004.1 Mg-protoporphyrin IX methyl transferase [Legionella geestiana]